MTPYELEHAIDRADALVAEHGSIQLATFRLLKTLLRHEADKEAERNLAKSEPLLRTG